MTVHIHGKLRLILSDFRTIFASDENEIVKDISVEGLVIFISLGLFTFFSRNINMTPTFSAAVILVIKTC